MKFKAGKLYKRELEKNGFMLLDKSVKMHISLSDEELHITDGIILVLEPLYIHRTRLRKTRDDPEAIRYHQWCLKILRDDKIGYVNLWEDEWNEVESDSDWQPGETE